MKHLQKMYLKKLIMIPFVLPFVHFTKRPQIYHHLTFANMAKTDEKNCLEI